MPWVIKFEKGKAKPWRVKNQETGADRGGSSTKEQAKKHLAAMYANVPEARKK